MSLFTIYKNNFPVYKLSTFRIYLEGKLEDEMLANRPVQQKMFVLVGSIGIGPMVSAMWMQRFTIKLTALYPQSIYEFFMRRLH